MRALVFLCLLMPALAVQAQELSNWRDSASRSAIVEFVEAVSREDSPDFVPAAERIAVFDNDGTLWAEQPAYFQLFFALDRVRAMSAEHPDWRTRQPFKAAIEGDLEAVAATGLEGVLQLVTASHSGMSSEQFSEQAAAWLSQARHPQSGRLYTQMVYQPMLELLGYLRASGFTVFIVSGGGAEFVRAFSEPVYGIPRNQVVGSTIEMKYDDSAEQPFVERLPAIAFVNDKAGKPVGIQRHIGRRPIAAFGNSDGDFEMLAWTTAGAGRRLGVLLHHTDAEREWAYDRDSHIGKLSRGLDEGAARGWVIVDMKKDWKAVFPE
ncbi:MAG: HAD family hydrolase [Halieaceae bacterium]|jgi:phosphoserine phosphatase|nr:HAD family hydrolase [Halieaceae bacterium]